MCFVWISEQTAIISLYSINWLVFITQTECVYCAVRTECLYTIQVIFWSLRGYAVTAAQLIHQSLEAGDFDARPRCKLHTLLSHHRRTDQILPCHSVTNNNQCNRMLSQFRTVGYAVTPTAASVAPRDPARPLPRRTFALRTPHGCTQHAQMQFHSRPSLRRFSWNSRTHSSFMCRSLIANSTQTGQYCGKKG